MFCVYCGTKLEDEALFCVNCGKKVEEDNTSNKDLAIQAEKVIKVAEPKAAPETKPAREQRAASQADQMIPAPVIVGKNNLEGNALQKKAKTKKSKGEKVKENKEVKQKKSKGLSVLWAFVGIIIGLAISVAIIFLGKNVDVLARGMEKLGITAIHEDIEEDTDEDIQEETDDSEEVEEPEEIEDEETPAEEIAEEVVEEEVVEEQTETEVICDDNVCYVSNGKIEGNGYASLEEAMENYITTFNSGDFNKLIQCYSVESYVDNYTLSKQIERVQGYNPSHEIRIPNYSDFAREINIKSRQNTISRQLMRQYIMYMGWDNKSEVPALGESTPDEYIEKNMPNKEDSFFGKIEFVSYVDEQKLVKYLSGKDSWNEQNSKEQLEKLRVFKNAEAVDSLGALLKTDNGYYFLAAGFIKYNGKWYVDTESLLASVLGIPVDDGNMYYVGKDLPKGAKLLLR